MEIDVIFSHLKPSFLNRHRLLWCVTWLLCLTAPVLSNAADAGEVKGSPLMTKRLHLLEDPTGNLTFSQVSNLADSFEEINSHKDIYLGYSQSVFWLKLTVANRWDRDADFFLNISYPFLDYLELYYQDANGVIVRQQAGDRQSFSSREISSRHPVFKLPINKGAEQTFFLKIKSESVIEIPLALLSGEDYTAEVYQGMLLFGLLYGALLIVIIYNAVIFFIVRDKLYVYYLANLIFVALGSMSWEGLAYQYFWPDSPGWADISMLFFTACGTWTTLKFSQELLYTKQKLPKLNILLEIIKTSALIQIFVVVFAPYTTASQFNFVLTSIGSITCLLVGVVAVIHGIQLAKLYLTGWAVVFIGLILINLAALGLIPTYMAPDYILSFSRVFEICIFSIALAGRITQLKDERNQAQAKEVIATALANAKNRFIANMSHELRTPMNAVLGFTHLAQRQKPMPMMSAYLNNIEQASKNLTDIVNEILDFSKIEAKQLVLEKASFSLMELLSNIATLFAVDQSKKQIEIHITVAPDTPKMLIGDAVRLRQVIVNLISNAVKFTSNGDVHLTVSLARQQGNKITLDFSVTDTGIGISASEQKRIFQPFVQADESTTRRYGGTGLGLNICQRLVELMGGKIECNSNPDEGSQFSFNAKFVAPELADITPCATEPKPTVLFVCENEITRQAVASCLAWLQGNVVCAKTADVLTLTQSFSLIIADNDLQDITGAELLNILCQQAEFNDTAMALLSEFGTPRHALLPAHIPTLQKPIDLAKLEALIHGHSSTKCEPEAVFPEGQLSELEILLVDDNRLNQELGGHLLSQAGAKVDIVANGKESLKAMHKKRYQLVLMDLHMPVMDGLTALRHIRREPKNDEVIVICLSASPLSEHLAPDANIQFDGELRKPFEPKELYQLLETFTYCKAQTITGEGCVNWVNESPSWIVSLPGICVESLFERIGQHPQIIRELLDRFINEHQASRNELETLWRVNDFDGFYRKTHNLAGAAACLNANTLHELTMVISQAMHKSQDWPTAGQVKNLYQETDIVLESVNLLKIKLESIEELQPFLS